MRKTRFTSGDWNAICDVCGFKFKATDLVQRWDGLMVCQKDWETRHPQDLIRPIPDQQKLPWTRPESTDVFVQSDASATCNRFTRQAVADIGTADCMRADFDMGLRYSLTPMD